MKSDGVGNWVPLLELSPDLPKTPVLLSAGAESGVAVSWPLSGSASLLMRVDDNTIEARRLSDQSTSATTFPSVVPQLGRTIDGTAVRFADGTTQSVGGVVVVGKAAAE
jgi:hypothetical protein